jgi:splicing factor 3A subunit 1
MDKITMGELGDEAAGDKGEKGDPTDGADTGAAMDVGLEPPPPEFIIDLPHISSIDLCVSSTLSFSFLDTIL